MISYPDIDPILFSIGPLQIRWYGLAYVIGVIAGYSLFKNEFKRRCNLTNDQILNCITSIVVGIVLGGRIGYVLFYGLSGYLKNPLEIIAIWQGGMSYHGGAIGAALGLIVYGAYCKCNKWDLLDILGIGSTIGICLGRLANFINGELYGRVTTVSWGMIFPGGGTLPRHPSQLYEAFFEGFLLFIVLYVCMKKYNLKSGILFSFYLIGYGIARFFIEFFREPDAHVGYIANSVTMGQCLCIVMIILGGTIFINRQGIGTK